MVAQESVSLEERCAGFAQRFSHPLLQLMPFPPTAPSKLLRLQTTVLQLLGSEIDVSAKLTSIELLPSLLKESSVIDVEANEFTEAVVEAVVHDQPSPRLYECWADVRLAQQKLRLVGVGYPMNIYGLTHVALEMISNERTPPPTTVSRSVTRVWRELVTRLEAMSDSQLNELDVDELIASIRCIRALALFGNTQEAEAAGRQRRQRFFEGVGLALWDRLYMLMNRREELGGEFRDMYGPPAQKAVLLHLRGEALAESMLKESAAVPEVPTAHHVVIRGQIPPTTNAEDKVALARLEVLQKPLPLVTLPPVEEIERIGRTLHVEFPWATQTVDDLIGELKTRKLFGGVDLGGSPTLLVGPPGSGKSRLVRRIAEEFELPFLPLSLAGASDSRMLLGTARGWSSAKASAVVDFLVERQTASAMVLLDEIDKVAHNTRNDVAPSESLLGLLEPENSTRWFDSFVQAPCDLSKLMFWATANRLGTLSAQLLSRFRVVLVPEPTRDHFDVIARGALVDLAAEWGLPAGTLPQVDLARSPLKPRSARDVKVVVRGLLGQWAQDHVRRCGQH